MGIVSSILERSLDRGGRRARLSSPPEWLVSAFGGGETASGVKVDETKALTFSAVYACMRVLSEGVASLPLPVYRRMGVRGKRRDPGHNLFRLLHDRPNPEMTSFTFRETQMSHVLLWGNSYAEIERDRAGRVIGLWPLLPDRTWPERKNKKLRYVTRVGNEEVPLSADRVFHVPGLGFDGLVGYAPITLFRQAVGLGLTAEEFGARFYGSGARPSGVMEMESRFPSQEARDDFRKQLQAV